MNSGLALSLGLIMLLFGGAGVGISLVLSKTRGERIVSLIMLGIILAFEAWAVHDFRIAYKHEKQNMERRQAMCRSALLQATTVRDSASVYALLGSGSTFGSCT